MSPNKRRKIVYNSIFAIIDRCTKIIKYILVIIKIDVVELAKVFFDKIVLRFETSIDIVRDKEFFSLVCSNSLYAFMHELKDN